MPRYRLLEGSAQQRYIQSWSKITLYGGGYANGKTAALCIKALQVAKDYPGANMLLARATYPKLKDTLLTEFKKWCPADWIKSFPQDTPTCTLTNGTVINFRYVAQQGKSEEATTSNLLSATYDFIGIDQCEDPEITEKDFLDLLGRLRGGAEYRGNDPRAPRTGPRLLALTCNPTRNWVWRRLVHPLKLHQDGKPSPELMKYKDGTPLLELFEASTYDNAHNLGADFIETLESTYTGQMRDRFLLGLWASYEGLIYPMFDPAVHVVEHQKIVDYYHSLRRLDYMPTIREAYDHGIAKPSCYGFGFTDQYGNKFIVDGFYKAEASIEWAARSIKRIRDEYKVHLVARNPELLSIYADPAIFRRTSGDKRTVGVTVSGMFDELGITMARGNNDILNGIVKTRAALAVSNIHRNPITGNTGAPHLYVSTQCPWWANEITEYMWSKDTKGTAEDKPRDGNDHAMDMTRYWLSDEPDPAAFVRRKVAMPPEYFKWHERETAYARHSRHRYG